MREAISEQEEEIVERRYTFPVGKLMGFVRETLKWADGKLVKEITEQEVKAPAKKLHCQHFFVCIISHRLRHS